MFIIIQIYLHHFALKIGDFGISDTAASLFNYKSLHSEYFFLNCNLNRLDSEKLC